MNKISNPFDGMSRSEMQAVIEQTYERLGRPIKLVPSAEQLAARSDPRSLEIEVIFRNLAEEGLIETDGEERWSHRTGRFQKVWRLSVLGRRLAREGKLL
jgi:hypothetical protein